jgi:hypothetical protein
MRILAARKYPNPRKGQLSLAESETRRLAYAIKDPRSPSADFDTAARAMARLITAPCWLVPVPDSHGSTRANVILCSHIARHVSLSTSVPLSATGRGVRGEVSGNNPVIQLSSNPVCQIAHALRRTMPIFPQCERHRRNLPATPPTEHHLKATLWSLGHRQVYFVDNVATSGNTLRAAYAAMNRGAGLVFADAGNHTRNANEKTLL